MNKPLKVFLLPNPGFRDTSVYIKSLSRCMESYSGFVKIVISKNKIYHHAMMTAHIIHIHWPEILLGINRFDDSFSGFINKTLRFIYWITLLILSKLSNKRIVITNHNILPHNKQLSSLDYLLIYNMLRLSDRIIVLNNYSKKIQCLLYGDAICRKTIVIPHHHFNRIYGEKIEKTEARKKLGIPINKFVIITIGTLTDYKDPELLLDIIREVCRESRRALFMIIGRQREEFVRRVKMLNINQECLQLINEYVPDYLLLVYLSAADLALVTYKRIWSSAQLALYIPYGVPILVSMLPPLLEELSSIPEYFFIKNKEDAVSKIKEMIMNKEFYVEITNRYRKSLKQIIIQRDPSKVARKHVKLYLTLLHKTS